MTTTLAREHISRCGPISLAVLLCALYVPPLTAQHSSPSERPGQGELVIKRNVRRVVVDVVVTDAYRKPVRGLTKKDFSVTEDGKSQKVLSFDVQDLDSAFVPPKLPPLPPNTFVNVPAAPERGPLYVLLLDLVNTNWGDQPFARQQLLKFLKDKPPGTRFAIFVLSDGLSLIQGFTDDKNQLLEAADPKKPKPHIPRVFLYGPNYGKGARYSWFRY
jgi:VWFA-related protein